MNSLGKFCVKKAEWFDTNAVPDLIFIAISG